MFAPTYFPTRFFAARYWPPGVEDDVPHTDEITFVIDVAPTVDMAIQDKPVLGMTSDVKPALDYDLDSAE